MKTNFPKAILFIFLTLIFWSCKKIDPSKETVPDKNNIENGLTNSSAKKIDDGNNLIVLKFYKTYPYVQSFTTEPSIKLNTNNIYPIFATVNGYQVVYTCSGAHALNFPDIITSLGGGGIGASTIPVVVDGFSYTAQFTYAVLVAGTWYENHYQLLNVPVASGYLCTNPTIYFEFAAEEETLYQGLATTENTCNVNGSWVPHGFTTATGSLSLVVPILFCDPPCSPALPANYRFRYRIINTSTWYEVLVASPTYYNSFTTITGLPTGEYEIEGRNECSGVSPSPWVASQTGHVNVP